MAKKQRDISAPLSGMNRSTGGHSLKENQYPFQLNGRMDTEEMYALTDEQSNILATKYKTGFKFVGGKNHIVRNKTYIFLTNPTTGVSEIGCIVNTKDFTEAVDTEANDNGNYTNIEATPLEETTQVPHQTYETILEDSCNLCLGFSVDKPIIDIVIKEENIGTTMWWTSSPGEKEFRYLQLDNIEQYKTKGNSNCGEATESTCIDCDKLRVFPLYSELKTKDYQRVLGGNLKKGSYEILGAYCDQLGNEFTSYTTLSSIIPIFDEANIIHEQEDNNAETNFAIKLNLDTVDEKFRYYKIAIRYYTSKGVFTSFENGVYGTSNKSIIISDNNGIPINNNKLNLVKPFIESVDGLTVTNNTLILNGVKEREPINLQPVVSLAGLGVKWMSYRAKENLYANADSYKYAGYNRDENVPLSIDFGFKEGFRTDPFIFIPRPPTEDELSDFTTGDDYDSINNVVGNCDGTIRNKKWQFYNTATEIGPCPLSSDIETVTQTENTTTFTSIEEVSTTSGLLEIGKTYRIDILKPGDNFSNVGFSSLGVDFIAIDDTPTAWTEETVVFNVTDGIPPVPPGTISNIDVNPRDAEDLDLRTFIEQNIDDSITLQAIAPYIDLTNLTEYNNLPNKIVSECTPFLLEEESINILNIDNENIIFTYPPDSSDYASIVAKDQNIYEKGTEVSLTDIDFSISYHMQWFSSGSQIRQRARKRITSPYNIKCRQAAELQRITNGDVSLLFQSHYHDNVGALTLADMQDQKIDMPSNAKDIIGTGINDDFGGEFTNKMHKNALWFKTNSFNRNKFYINLSRRTRCDIEGFKMNGTAYTFGRNEVPFVRISFFNSCSATTPIEITPGVFASDIYNLKSSNFIEVTSDIISKLNGSGDLYISVESAIRTSEGLGPDWEEQGIVEFQENGDQSYRDAYTTVVPTLVTTYISALPCGLWGIVDRDEEPNTVSFTWDRIEIQKLQKYTTACNFEIPILQDCKPIPYKYGELGYYESTETYPDNEELFDSSKLTLYKDKITNADFLNKLFVYTENQTDERITLSDEANFRCKNVRFFKLPDNKVSPHINSQVISSNTDSIISPLGFTIDGEVIQNILDIAVDNNLLTEEQKNNIVDYKIYRADATSNRSVVASGIAFNSKSYEKNGENISYFNYPFNSLGKDKYFPNSKDEDFDKIQVSSPEFDYFKPSLPDEMSLQGFMFGKSNTRVIPVEEHSKMVILGNKARSLAKTLATLEVVAESALNLASASEVWRVDAGLVFSANPVGAALHITLASIEIFSGVVYRYGRYKLEWERSFEKLGTPYNFGYYTSSNSNYNYIRTLQKDGNRLRGLSVKKYLKPGNPLIMSDNISGKVLKINNLDREELPFFSLGDYPINGLDSEYLTFDNSDTAPNLSSQVLSSEIGCSKGKNSGETRNVASPYIAFKNYIPNQYGTVGSIRWVDTNYSFSLDETGVKEGILGGDTFITRHSKRRKVRLFESDLLEAADLTPFPYRFNSNYGDPKFYIDYKVNSDFTSGGKTFPDIFYDVQFDCNTSSNSFYIEPPGKFYLYSISSAYFLCETRINTNFRNARKEPWNQFYPQNTDYEAITQPSIVSLRRKENFFYNKAYLQTDILNSKFSLPDYYSKEDEAKKAYNINSGIYSLPDVNENSITEPWLLYRPNDKFTLNSRYGNLINLEGIESGQILMYFEDALQLQNPVNQFTDGSTTYNSDLGNGGLFAKRPLTIRSTEIGYGGSQSKHILSNEFGSFHADVKRGQVFNYTGGQNLQEISRYSGGKPNGMDVWFKEHLPFKITKYFPNVPTDNPYNGVGIHWGYDSKYRRILLTKKDYIPVDDCVEYIDGKGFVLNKTECNQQKQTVCPEGFTYDENTEKCISEYTLVNFCPDGYTYDQVNKKCIKVEKIPAIINQPSIDNLVQPSCAYPFGIFNIVDYNPQYEYVFTPSVEDIRNDGSIIASSGNYTFKYIDAEGCESADSETIVINEQPFITATATPSSLTVDEGEEFTIALTSNTVGTTFTWTVVQSGVTGATSGSGSTITQTLTGAGTVTYTIIPYNEDLDCYGESITVNIEVQSIVIPCNQGMDVAFVVDYTGSMSGAIEDVKLTISDIANTISVQSEGDYRMSLILVDEYNGTSDPTYVASSDYTNLPSAQKFQNINVADSKVQYFTAMEVFQNNNESSFTTQLNKINSTGFPLGSGASGPEPTDFATDRVVNHDFGGQFREEVSKIVIIITDNVSSGDDDLSNAADTAFINNLTAQCVAKGVRVLLMKTNTASMPNLEVLATGTEGLIVENTNGSAISQAIADICI